MSEPIIDHEQPSIRFPVADRRRHKRFAIARPGKIFRRATQQYVPATSRDLSFTGALLELESERPMAVGEVLDIGLAMTSSAVVPSSALLRGIVVRSETVGEFRQLVAIRYLHREALSEAA